MLVFKNDGKVYFATPLGYHAFDCRMSVDHTYEDNCDSWHLNDGHGTLAYVCADSNRVIDLIRYSDSFDCEFSREGMREAINRCKRTLSGTNCDMGEDKPDVTFVVARGDKAFVGRLHGELYEIDEYRLIGERLDLATAAYETNKDVSDAVERVRRVYEDAERMGTAKYFPVALMNTAESGCTLIYEDKIQKI